MQRNFGFRSLKVAQRHSSPGGRTLAHLGLFLSLSLSCDKKTPEPHPDPFSQARPRQTIRALQASGARPPSPSVPKPPALEDPAPLFALPVSAYRASLAIDPGAIYLLTEDALYRITDDRSVRRIRLDLSFGAALTQDSIVFWSRKAVWQASKHTGKQRRVATLPHQPQYFVASGGRFAWLDRSAEGRYTIQTLQSGSPRTLYVSTGAIDAMALLDGSLFFAERVTGSGWRFGRVSLDGGEARFTLARSGRSPSMLAGADSLAYYDGNSLKVQVLSLDFQEEETIIADFICSPLAASRRIYCAQLRGLFELAGAGSSPKLIANAAGWITAVAASATRVAWLTDPGQDRLELHARSLDPAP